MNRGLKDDLPLAALESDIRPVGQDMKQGWRCQDGIPSALPAHSESVKRWCAISDPTQSETVHYYAAPQEVFVAGGTFVMGSDENLIPPDKEGPTRSVIIKSFWMDQYEVSSRNLSSINLLTRVPLVTRSLKILGIRGPVCSLHRSHQLPHGCRHIQLVFCL
jgi:hypothetical protein